MPIKPENRELYPPNWDHISDMIRFGRAGGRCECLGECLRDHTNGAGEVVERCAAAHSIRHPMTGSMVFLTTGHLDHTPENSDNPGGVFVELPLEDSNLRAWCQRCHLSYDRDRHVANAAATRERQSEQMRLI